MPLQRANTLYLRNTTTVDTGTGIDIRHLDDVAAGTIDATQSIRNPTQNTQRQITVDPATTLRTTASNLDTLHRLGWALTLDDMQEIDARCVTALAAQTVSVVINGTATGTGAGNVGANDVFTSRASLWKYNPTTDAGTLIAQNTGNAPSFAATLDYGPTAFSATVNLSIPATTFTTDEVLLLQVGGTMACGAGLLGGARTFTVALRIDTDAVTRVEFGTSGLRQACDEVATVEAQGRPARSLLAVSKPESVEAEVTASRNMLIVKKDEQARADVTVTKTLTVAYDATVEAEVTPADSLRVRLARSVEAEVTPADSLRARLARTVEAEATPDFDRQWRAFRSATAEAVVTPDFDRSVIFVRTFVVDAVGTVTARIELPLDDLPTPEGGTIVVRRPIFPVFG